MSNRISIQLDINRCNGCINCLKRCPTQAIRVRDKKAYMLTERCIDCGLCIRVCPHKAKKTTSDSIAKLKEYKYTIALPPPSLYGQFNNLANRKVVNDALKAIGFDDVFEVTKAAFLMRNARSEYIEKNKEKIVYPIISTSCSVVTRLIMVKYPDLIENLLPLITPIELAALLGRDRAIATLNLKAEEIGCVFITPCPAKVSEAHSPIGTDKKNVDLAIAINEIYPILLKQMESKKESPTPKTALDAVVTKQMSEDVLFEIDELKYLAVDGIENVIKVLEDIESHDYGLEYVQLNACNAGCYGGVLQVENPYIARFKSKNIKPEPEEELLSVEIPSLDRLTWDKELEYNPVMELGGNRRENFERYSKLQKLTASLPGLDCGRCGAPTCASFAEDVVRDKAEVSDCVVIFREQMEHIFKMMGASFDLKGDEQD